MGILHDREKQTQTLDVNCTWVCTWVDNTLEQMIGPDFVLIVDQRYCKCFGNLPDFVLIVDQRYCKCFGNLPDFVLIVDQRYCKCFTYQTLFW